jgi:hypothetical protein
LVFSEVFDLARGLGVASFSSVFFAAGAFFSTVFGLTVDLTAGFLSFGASSVTMSIACFSVTSGAAFSLTDITFTGFSSLTSSTFTGAFSAFFVCLAFCFIGCAVTFFRSRTFFRHLSSRLRFRISTLDG